MNINDYHFVVENANSDSYQIEIETNCYFNPFELGESEDNRDLSMQLYYIGAPSRYDRA